MADVPNFRVRVFFRKAGRCAMLSHLEVARALERAVRRAGLPYAISQGFSPHMRIAFGAALPVGVGGERECFDLQMTRYIAPDKVCAALQASSVDDLMVCACESITARDKAASVAFPVSTYRAHLSAPPPSLIVPETLTVIRKKKEKVLAVRDYLVGEVAVSGSELGFTLVARPEGSLRPDVLVQELLAGHPGLYPLSLTRVSQCAR